MITPFAPLPPGRSHVLRRALVPDLASPEIAADTLDIVIADGIIRDMRPAIEASALPETDLAGSLVLPLFTDIHTHLDKGFIWTRRPNPDGTFASALAAAAADREANWSRDDIERRMEFALECAYAHGTAAIRTHLDTSGVHQGLSWELFREVQARWRGRIELQAVSLCTLDAYAGENGERIAREVAATAGGVLGGVAMHGPGVARSLDRLIDLATAHGLALDLHVDENGIEGGTALMAVAEAVLRRRFNHPVLCGHCCSLAVQSERSARDVVATVAASGIGVVSLPMCNLYLQDRWTGRTPRWRGVTLLHELRDAGVPVMLASDNTRDPFYAYGDLDMLEVFREGARIAHLDHPLTGWVDAVTCRPADWMGRRCGLAPGVAADFVAFDAASFNELLSRPQADRLVLRGGKAIDTQPPRYRVLQSGVCT